MAPAIAFWVIAHALVGTSSHMVPFAHRADAERRRDSLIENGHQPDSVVISEAIEDEGEDARTSPVDHGVFHVGTDWEFSPGFWDA